MLSDAVPSFIHTPEKHDSAAVDAGGCGASTIVCCVGHACAYSMKGVDKGCYASATWAPSAIINVSDTMSNTATAALSAEAMCCWSNDTRLRHAWGAGSAACSRTVSTTMHVMADVVADVRMTGLVPLVDGSLVSASCWCGSSLLCCWATIVGVLGCALSTRRILVTISATPPAARSSNNFGCISAIDRALSSCDVVCV